MWIYKFNILIEIYTYLNSGRTIEKINRKGTSGKWRGHLDFDSVYDTKERGGCLM